ncbi:restriction endonuclease subunit S [Desulfococcus sp.]|uniref:restriction endonuclease subunit S n=1 Tax=Desulfococcus sp. TaxID=2025834 RepID=UPI003593C36E
MKYKAYSKYKDSGVEWLGEVPEHWEESKLKYLFKFVSGGTPPTEDERYWNGELPWVSPKDMKSFRIIDTEDHVTRAAVSQTSTTLVNSNTVLIVTRSGILRHSLPVAIATKEMTINQDIKGLISFKQNIDPEYMARFIEGHQAQLLSVWRKEGTTVESLETDIIKDFTMVLPPAIEQTTITDFLDREINKVDTLLVQKRALIEKLKEKRTALISRTVTRGLPPEVARAAGLDPHPELKPSGVEWLGDVPEHWEIKKGRHLGILLGSVSPSEGNYTDNEKGIPFAKVDDLNHIDSSLLLLNTKNRVEGFPVTNRKLILFPKRGAAIFTNKVATAEGKFLFDSNIMGWEIYHSNETKYVAYCLIARRLDDLADVSTVPQINNKHIYPALFPKPPINEQCLIVDYLEDVNNKIDQLITKVETAINRLQEYRTALITATVTGKIDVRETQA